MRHLLKKTLLAGGISMMMLSAAGCYYGSGMGYGSYANANKIKTTAAADTLEEFKITDFQASDGTFQYKDLGWIINIYTDYNCACSISRIKLSDLEAVHCIIAILICFIVPKCTCCVVNSSFTSVLIIFLILVFIAKCLARCSNRLIKQLI